MFLILYIKLGQYKGSELTELFSKKKSQLGDVDQNVSKLGQKWTPVCLKRLKQHVKKLFKSEK